MVRGRRKVPSSSQKHEPQMGSLSPLSPSPSIKPKCRRKFKGKLSHTSPVSANKITQYYSPTSHESQDIEIVVCYTATLNSLNIAHNSPSRDDGKRKVLQEANNILENRFNNLNSTGQLEINKTESSCSVLSPSTALSQLKLNSPRKLDKCRKRLTVINENPVRNTKTSLGKVSTHAGNAQTKLTEFFPVRRSSRKTRKTVLEEKKRTIQEAILSNREDGLQVRHFEGKGRGIVAARRFERGEFVVEYAGELITMDEAQTREANYARNENIGCYMYYFKHKDDQYCIDATAETGRLGRLLNHSRNGNLSTKTIEVHGVPRLILLAKEDIELGCELTYDYGDRSKVSLQHHPWLAQ